MENIFLEKKQKQEKEKEINTTDNKQIERKYQQTNLAKTAIFLAHFDWRRYIRVRGQRNFFGFAIGTNSGMLMQHTCRYREFLILLNELFSFKS